MRKHSEIVVRSFANVLEARGGMRRTWLRGCENVDKRYLVHVAGYNLGILRRALVGAGTPMDAASVRFAFLLVIQADAIAFVILAVSGAEIAALMVAVACEAA
jgi:transposase